MSKRKQKAFIKEVENFSKKLSKGLKVFENKDFLALTSRIAVENKPLELKIFKPEVIKELSDYMQKEILPAMNAFGKRQSQYMNIMMTLNMETPARNLRQCISEIERRREALREAETRIKNLLLQYKKFALELEKLESQPEPKDYFEKEERQIKIWKLQTKLSDLQKKITDQRLYIEGAIKHIHCFIKAYQDIVKTYNMENWTEEDFEKAEHEFHVKRAFTQALRDFRNHGTVGIGNQEYFEICGINPTEAIIEIKKYIAKEFELINQGKEVPITMFYDFLDRMYEKYKDTWKLACKRKGVKFTFYDGSLWKRELENTKKKVDDLINDVIK